MKPRILIVDDDRDMVRTLRDILRLRGWETGAAYSGGEAIQAQRLNAYDCVLMDIKMPGVDGIAADKMLRRLFPRLPVILMTAHRVADVDIDETTSPIVPKPLDLPKLFAMLDGPASLPH
jgi:two-component system response regulator (stage 0 sporulation protein F)